LNALIYRYSNTEPVHTGISGLCTMNYCRTKVRLGVVEAVNGNIKALLRRGRGYRNLNYLAGGAEVSIETILGAAPLGFKGAGFDSPLRVVVAAAFRSGRFLSVST
jgi:Transposase